MTKIVFFFSSRRRHTRSLCDWSSDVCSSDLLAFVVGHHDVEVAVAVQVANLRGRVPAGEGALPERSEERRVGKECRSRWSPDHSQKNTATYTQTTTPLTSTSQPTRHRNTQHH